MDLREIGWGSVDWIQLAQDNDWWRIGWGSVDCIQLAQDRDRWRALVNTVMNLRVLAPRSYLQVIFLDAVKSYNMELLALLPLQM
jgi:hypothetical protein